MQGTIFHLRSSPPNVQPPPEVQPSVKEHFPRSLSPGPSVNGQGISGSGGTAEVIRLQREEIARLRKQLAAAQKAARNHQEHQNTRSPRVLPASWKKRPVRPPFTVPMLRALKQALALENTFDACIWAMATCAFFGMMRLGELCVRSRADFDQSRHLKREDVAFAKDMNGKEYARLALPMAQSGEKQSVSIAAHGDLCPLDALSNLARVVPAGRKDPLFSWTDRNGAIRPITRSAAKKRINEVLATQGLGSTFDHSFRVGGALFYLADGISPEVVRLAGRWRSYGAYVRDLGSVASRPSAGEGRVVQDTPTQRGHLHRGCVGGAFGRGCRRTWRSGSNLLHPGLSAGSGLRSQPIS